MFGMGGGLGGMGGGFGSGNRNVRSLRLGALVLLLVAGLVFRHQGTGYETTRVLYGLLVVGLLMYTFGRRRAGGRALGRRGPAGFGGVRGGDRSDFGGPGPFPGPTDLVGGDRYEPPIASEQTWDIPQPWGPPALKTPQPPAAAAEQPSAEAADAGVDGTPGGPGS